MKLEAISFKDEKLHILDQTQLPQRHKIITLDSLNKSIEAIKKLRVRGAPAIGIVAAYALYIECVNLNAKNKLNSENFETVCMLLAQSRPTAVNLFWAIDKMKKVFYAQHGGSNNLLSELKKCAVSIHSEDKESCKKIGLFGSQLIKNAKNVLTHCNAGILATGGNGTALSVIYSALALNSGLHVYVDETRPLGQGARLTHYELKHNNVDCTLLADNAAGTLFAKGEIDAVIVGADRIAMNGDFANKIGTFPLAVLAGHFNVPFYVAAPLSTFDKSCNNQQDIPIEQRGKEEVLSFWNIDNQDDYNVYNPAFDITPAKYVTAFITNAGIIKKPYKNTINKIIQSKEM